MVDYPVHFVTQTRSDLCWADFQTKYDVTGLRWSRVTYRS